MSKERIGLIGMLTGGALIIIIQLACAGGSLYLLYLLIMALRKYLGL